jgi:hypothetical protein
MATSFSATPSDWQGVDDGIHSNSQSLAKSGDVYGFVKDNTLEEVDMVIVDEGDIADYLIDKNNTCFGYIRKDGTVYLHKIAFDEMENGINDVIGRISSPSPYNDSNVLKYLVDDNFVCFGQLEKDGTVFIPKARIRELDGPENNFVEKSLFSSIAGLMAVGLDNIEMSNNPKMMAVLNNINTDEVIRVNVDNDNKKNLSACVSIIDDDTVDRQIPVSTGGSTPSINKGGYFSVLLPMMLSLGQKHGRKCFAGLACEGQRVGLTTLQQSNDNYTELNMNGEAVKYLHDRMEWNVFNHSMTGQLPQRAYYVDGIDSALASTILANGYYDGQLSFANTIVLDRLTGKWYEVNSDLTAWVERIPTKKYAMPFYQDYNTHDWYFNRDFDFEYSWGEFNKRAKELGLPFEKVIVHNGGTSSVYMISASRKYAYSSIRTEGTFNYPPLAATVNRTSTIRTGWSGNIWDDQWVATQLANIDTILETKAWMVFMSHSNEEHHYNYYVNGQTYPSAEAGQPALRGKDDNYPDEWIVPLKYEEILDIISTNTHDYISNPPSRLGIGNWSEWHPAGGTLLAAFYYVLDYALSKGIDIVPPMRGLTTHGNILNIGVDRNGQTYPYDSAVNQVPYTDEETSFLTVGANMEIRLFNSKNL